MHSGPIRPFIVILSLLMSPAGLQALDLTDCDERVGRHRDAKLRCKLASSYAGECIPAADFARHGCLELDSDARLCDSEEPFDVAVHATTSDVTLDCRGARIDQRWEDGKRSRSGVRFPYERSVSNVTIRNCSIGHVGRYGLDLKRIFRGAELRGEMLGHTGLRFENISIRHARGFAVYIGQNAAQIYFENLKILDAYGGVYVEAGAQHVSLVSPDIRGSRKREAIAIDSAQHVLVRDGHFENNGDAITIYKNCGERYGQVCPIVRALDASHHQLLDNYFGPGEDVHVGWRQFKLYGLGHCTNIPVVGFWRDQVHHIEVVGNHFAENSFLEIHDGPVRVEDNRFDAGAELELGTDQPGLFDWIGEPVPISGRVSSNTFDREAELERGTCDTAVYEDLVIFDNRYQGGQCMPENGCGQMPDPEQGASTSGVSAR